jgi:hypothetical protein
MAACYGSLHVSRENMGASWHRLREESDLGLLWEHLLLLQDSAVSHIYFLITLESKYQNTDVFGNHYLLFCCFAVCFYLSVCLF